ncbi:MAG: alpha/beta fold hydrolase [Candidatus Lokiarchaeota archaeon]|nr:alpha/beta fold hydrolase [Candidatus Lokiarchaeota archaeon]
MKGVCETRRNRFNPFPEVDIRKIPYHPALQQLRERYSPDPASTKQETGYFTAADGTRLFTRRWYKDGVQRKGVVVCFHGLGGDSEYFVLFADQVLAAGFEVAIHDYAGHGLSGGIRGDIDAIATYTRHAAEYLQHVHARARGLPIFALGESMGGTVLVNTLVDGVGLPPIEGVLLFAPGIKIKSSSVSFKDVMMVLGMVLTYPFKPGRLSYSVRPVREKTLKDGLETMDPLHFEYDMENPLHLDRVSTRLILQLHKGFNRGFKLGPGSMKQPLVVFLGENDLAIDRDGVRAFVDRSAAADKDFIVVPGAPHAMFTHRSFQPCWETVRTWLEQRALKREG